MTAIRGEGADAGNDEVRTGTPHELVSKEQKSAPRGAIFGFIDQSLFSATSFAMAIEVARHATPTQYGAFSVAYVAYTLVLGVVEAFAAETFLVRGVNLDVTLQRRMLGYASGVAVATGVLCAALALLVATPGGGPFALVLPAMFVLAPLLFVQDVWRFGFFAMGRPAAAALNDLVWATLLGVGFLGGFLSRDWTSFVWIWAAAGATCGVLGAIQSRVVPRIFGFSRWTREHGAAAWRFAGEYLSLYGAAQGSRPWRRQRVRCLRRFSKRSGSSSGRRGRDCSRSALVSASGSCMS